MQPTCVTLASLSNLFSIDMVVLGLLALMLFGRDLPTVARNVGRVMAQLKRIASQASAEIRREMDEAAREADIRGELRPDPPKAPGPNSSSVNGAETRNSAEQTPDAAAGRRKSPPENTVSAPARPVSAPPPAVSPAASLDTFRIDVKPPTKIPPPV